MEFNQLTQGTRVIGVISGQVVTVISFQGTGPSSGTLTYNLDSGGVDQKVVSADDVADYELAPSVRWSFDADGGAFRLASEARRIESAHLFDPFTAVDAADIEPLPHQIEAVYERMLRMQPLRFLLADDPGAGKTIMSGLLIRELMIRGDVARCLIVAPGSLVEQWQDELRQRFNLSFELMSRAMVEAAATGNPFQEKNLLIARVDQLSRSEELVAKLEATDWDLVIVDEAHKMSAHHYGNEIRKTKRYQLGEVLRERSRNFLLLTATPHNGKNEDFLAFVALLDPERFEGRLRDGDLPDVSDLMRRYVKENLKTFDGKRLFPERIAQTLKFELSDLELELYEAVTSYVREGMNRAARLAEEGDTRRGVIVGFALALLQRRLASSPAAIHSSLQRRKNRLREQAEQLRIAAKTGEPIAVSDLPKGIKISDLEDLDYDEFDAEELEELEEVTIDAHLADATAEELELEVSELEGLEQLALNVRNSGEDRKWNELRDVLRSDEFKQGDPLKKLIVFSEHKDTLTYLRERVEGELGRPEAVVVIHGGVKREDRRDIQERFRNDERVQVLIATDAAGEGVNLQRANLMVNYDLPWNPNRLEQRFGRIHRIGQKLPCYLWNLVADQTREGQVFERLFQKIEQQRGVFGDQVYDVLGDPLINSSLQDLLIKAIREEDDPTHIEYLEEVIDAGIGQQLEDVLKERALTGGLLDPSSAEGIRDKMEAAQARRLQPGFISAFFTEALKQYGGRITEREQDRYQITRIPAPLRSRPAHPGSAIHDRYERVTFDKTAVEVNNHPVQADLVAPGHVLLDTVVKAVLEDYGHTLTEGATLIDPTDLSSEPRLLVYLEHAVADTRSEDGAQRTVSRRCQFVEITETGQVIDPGAQPYLNYQPLTEQQQELLDGEVDPSWANASVEDVAKNWAIEHLAAPHFDDVEAITSARVTKVRSAVNERLQSETNFWLLRAEEIKAQELAGKKPQLNSGRARHRADDLQARMERRMRELDQESDLHNRPPTVTAAALIIPQGFMDALAGQPIEPNLAADTAETDRRGVAAVMAAEQALGRIPEEQAHNNPGFDIESVDPETGTHYFIEVKSHLPQTGEIKVSAVQVRQGIQNPDRFRLAVASVPIDPDEEPQVKYLVRPFDGYQLHFAQTHLPLKLNDLLPTAGPPQ